MSIQGDSFTKRVMGELLNDGERTLEYNHPYNTNDSDQRRIQDEDTLAHMKAHLKQLKAAGRL
jgi:hypothetical protein